MITQSDNLTIRQSDNHQHSHSYHSTDPLPAHQESSHHLKMVNTTTTPSQEPHRPPEHDVTIPSKPLHPPNITPRPSDHTEPRATHSIRKRHISRAQKREGIVHQNSHDMSSGWPSFQRLTPAYVASAPPVVVHSGLDSIPRTLQVTGYRLPSARFNTTLVRTPCKWKVVSVRGRR